MNFLTLFSGGKSEFFNLFFEECKDWLEQASKIRHEKNWICFFSLCLSTLTRSSFSLFISRVRGQIENAFSRNNTHVNLNIAFSFPFNRKRVSLFSQATEKFCTFGPKTLTEEHYSPQFIAPMEGIVFFSSTLISSEIWVFDFVVDFF